MSSLAIAVILNPQQLTRLALACTGLHQKPGEVRKSKNSINIKENLMTVSLAPIIALLAGILILIMPRLLNYIVAGYLIIVGLVGIFGSGGVNLTL